MTVRYFAAAGAATGVGEERVEVADGTSVLELLRQLQDRHGAELRQVLGRCSYLLDEIAVRDFARPIEPNSTLDVLPPFAGG